MEGVQLVQHYLVVNSARHELDATDIVDHLTYLSELEAKGRLVLSGAFSDHLGGAYLIVTSSDEEAEEIVNADPLFIGGRAEFTVKRWGVAQHGDGLAHR